MLSESLAALDLEASAPPSFCCPIGRELMHDPVSCSDGHSYEREHIVRWLRESRLSPVTGAPLPSPDLRPNHALRNAIEEWAAQQQPSPPPEPEAPAVPPPSMLKRDLGSATAHHPWPAGADSWLRSALGASRRAAPGPMGAGARAPAAATQVSARARGRRGGHLHEERGRRGRGRARAGRAPRGRRPALLHDPAARLGRRAADGGVAATHSARLRSRAPPLCG